MYDLPCAKTCKRRLCDSLQETRKTVKSRRQRKGNGKCKLVRFSVARLREGKSARIADVKKWGSRFGSDLNNVPRYWSKILIWYFWILQLSNTIQFVKIGQWTLEKFRFQVRKRKKEIRANRDFSPQVVKPCSFLNSSLNHWLNLSILLITCIILYSHERNTNPYIYFFVSLSFFLILLVYLEKFSN